MRKANVHGVECAYLARDRAGYRAGVARLGPRLGARMMGATIYELSPGESVCPYHYHYGNEEWLLVLVGSPHVRTEGGDEELRPGDLVCFRSGPRGAHKVGNHGPDDARVLMVSTKGKPSVAVYPDSDKIAIWPGDKRDDLLLSRAARMGYWDGE